MTNYWKRVSSGKYLDLGNLKEEDLDIKDIQISLNQIKRFTGHHKDEEPLTVAQHSYLCYLLAKKFEPEDYELQLAVLTHDFAEMLLGDVSSPIKWILGDKWYNFAVPIERIFEKKFFGREVDHELHQRIKMYDLASMDIERRVLWRSTLGANKWPKCFLDTGNIYEKEDLFYTVNAYPISLTSHWEPLYKKVNG